MIKLTTEQIEFAKEVAKYILDGDAERDNYEEFIEEGNDPREHVYYKASVVIGNDDEFADDIDKYENQ
jgi:hypothetical protein